MKITINYNGTKMVINNATYTINLYKNEIEMDIEYVSPEIMINGNPLIPRLGFGSND